MEISNEGGNGGKVRRSKRESRENERVRKQIKKALKHGESENISTKAK